MADEGKAAAQLRYVLEGREDLVGERTRNLPAWANGNPQTYFRAAEQSESRAWTAFEEWKITLPHELSREQNQVLIEDMLDVIAGDRLPCTYGFHDPLTMDGQRQQPHIHLLISSRMTGTTDEYQRPIAQHFRRWNAKEPARGGAHKDPAFWQQGAVYAHRLMISDVLNVHLEAHGIPARVHPDTLESRGIDRAPEPKLLPSESAAFREKGEVSATMGAVLAIREQRAQQGPGEQNNARLYWEQRKAFLGLTRDMPREEKVGRIVALRHGMKLPTVQRSQPRQREAEVSEAELDKRWSRPIIGNKTSKIYHLPTHKNYGDVGPHNQVRFWTEREAQREKYRRARNEFGVGSETAMEAQPSSDTRHQARQRQAPGPRMAQTLRQLTRRLEGLEEARGRPRRMRVQLQEEERGLGY